MLLTVSTREDPVIEATHYPLLAEHVAGASFRALGERHNLSHEGARQVVMRQSTAFANECELATRVKGSFLIAIWVWLANGSGMKAIAASSMLTSMRRPLPVRWRS